VTRRCKTMMLDELEPRNYSQNTRRVYLYAMAEFARQSHLSPAELGLDHIRDHQGHLLREPRPNSVSVHVEATITFCFSSLDEARSWDLSSPRAVRV
jgi:Phage integrase, N-terminal SAM-like domain